MPRHDRTSDPASGDSPSLLPVIVLAAAGWVAWKAFGRRPRPAPRLARAAAPAPASTPASLPPESHEGYIRSAGPGEMHDRPRDWSNVDEASDESFPASDPPGRY